MVSLRLSRRAASVLASKGYEIGNQCPDLRRFSRLTLVSNPTVFHFHAPMIRFGTLEDYLGALSQAHRKKLANPPEPA
jgi:hypothetical protein